MIKEDIKIGIRVEALESFVDIAIGDQGIIIEDYGSGITVAWDKPDRPYPKGKSCQEVARMFAVNPETPQRDGFSKENELHFLQIITTK